MKIHSARRAFRACFLAVCLLAAASLYAPLQAQEEPAKKPGLFQGLFNRVTPPRDQPPAYGAPPAPATPAAPAQKGPTFFEKLQIADDVNRMEIEDEMAAREQTILKQMQADRETEIKKLGYDPTVIVKAVGMHAPPPTEADLLKGLSPSEEGVEPSPDVGVYVDTDPAPAGQGEALIQKYKKKDETPKNLTPRLFNPVE